jgi:protein SCO1
MTYFLKTLLSATLLFATPVFAHEYKIGDLQIIHPWARATPEGAKVAGGFLEITNHGATADKLIGGSLIAAGRFELHEMKMNNNVMQMRQLEKGLEIPAGATIELKPGSFHLMFMDLKNLFPVGEKIQGTLKLNLLVTCQKEKIMRIKTVRYLLWAAVAALSLVFFAAYFTQKSPDTLSFQAELGAPFTLTNQRGEPVTFESLKGAPHVIFFGFTHCPDVCPTALFDLTQVLDKLGNEGSNLKAYFITVDPERDTQELLRNYLASFSPRIQGLTGARAEIDKAIRGYRVFAKKIPNEGGYSYDHTAISYLFDKQGRLVGTLDYQENSDSLITKLRALNKK